MLNFITSAIGKYVALVFAVIMILFAARKSGSDAVKLANERMENAKNEKLLKWMDKEKELIHRFSDSHDSLERMRRAVNKDNK